MILQGQEHTLQRGGLTGERSYGIALSPKIYSMMSDKLYTDRIGSTVREVCSNAWDAQKMRSLGTGAEMEPFKVTLPTDLEPHFIVEDTGPGMPDQVAQDLYSTLGLSTKENTNDQIGAFGLGSKSPFSVTDTFTVENTYEGVTHFYLCFKQESGLPSLLKTGERNEGRTDGVKVIIPAPGFKYSDYKKALMKQLIVMEPKPVINNLESFEFVEPMRGLENEVGYILLNAAEFGLTGRSIYARMGMVLYPVDLNQVGLGRGIHTGLEYSATLVLEFPIGALEPLPSREGLTYDDNTKKNICSQYEEFASDYRARLKQQVESEPTPLDAWRRIEVLRKSTSIDLMVEDIYVLGTPINNSAIPNVWPKFYHEWFEERSEVNYDAQKEYDLEHGYDPNDQNRPGPQFVATKHPKSGNIPRYYMENFNKSDLRVNKKRNAVPLEQMVFSLLDAIDTGKHRYLLMDELESKYKVPRLKSWLNQITYNETFHIVYVDKRFTGSRTEFDDLLKSLERLHPGITQVPGRFTRFSQVARPARDKKERNLDEKETPGLSIMRTAARWERGFKWTQLEDWILGVQSAEEEDEELEELDENDEPIRHDPEIKLDNIFYVTATRNDLDDYAGKEVKMFTALAGEMGVNMIIVRKTGASYIPRLEKLGIKEFKAFAGQKMANFNPDDDYKRYNSAKSVTEQYKQSWYKWTVWGQLRLMRETLKASGEFVHEFMDTLHDIKSLVDGYSEAAKTPEVAFLDTLKARRLIDYIKTEDWYKNLEIDVSGEFSEQAKDFAEFYPVLYKLIEGQYNVDRIDPVALQYVQDYNELRGKHAPVHIDYTEVLESSII